jgi:hypothetical protein
LRPGETDVLLDLQEMMDSAFARAKYDSDTDYTRPPNPPLDPDDEGWAAELLKAKGLRR